MSMCVKVSGIRIVSTETVQSMTVNGRPITPGLMDTAAPLAWRDSTGAGVVVGVVDTGVDFQHDFLKDNILATKDFTGTRPDGWDDNGHGTHVCGIIKQMAPDVKMVVAKVLTANGSGTEANVAAAIRWLADWTGTNGEKVVAINMSLGGAYDDPAVRTAMEYADSKGVVLPSAAGNDGDENPATDEMGYPGRYPWALAVAAMGTTQDAFYNRPASFTSSGPNDPLDGVDICSYGVNVLSTLPGNAWGYLSGTSMATPHITGAVALIVEKYRRKHRQNPTGQAVYEAIIGLSSPVPMWDSAQQKFVTAIDWNTTVGAGRFTFDPHIEYVNVDFYVGGNTMYVTTGSNNTVTAVPLDTAPIQVNVTGGTRTLIVARPMAVDGMNANIYWDEAAVPSDGSPGQGKVTIKGYRPVALVTPTDTRTGA